MQVQEHSGKRYEPYVEPKHAIMSKEEALELHEYLKSVDGINVMGCDDPLGAVLGFVTFHDKNKKKKENEGYPCVYVENSFMFGWKFAKEVEETIRIEVDDIDGRPLDEKELQKAYDQIEKCITEKGWCYYDYPKRLSMGFIKFADLDSNEKSIAYSLRLSAYHALPSELKERLDTWLLENSKEKDENDIFDKLKTLSKIK